MRLSFKEFMSAPMSSYQPLGNADLMPNERDLEFRGEDSKNKPSKKSKKLTGINPDKMYGKRKKDELP